ncbi:UNKNOWN [Stylonychia lemnae]|uniref:Transmembrane protein n=1 Tax=Stylonychia lemnae TaxID=5949 RepID=A0A078AQ96_STYLE|nr:UNKNOWN [Stylonychia lemnae]|eukprot:CDW83118.1 UNKNOWN [Stylonychia lemnae]
MALDKAGVINLATLAYFKIYDSNFNDNYAKENSVINVLESSKENELLLSNCKFVSNSAVKNTIQIMFAQKSRIEGCQFKYNYASEDSKNIFIGFSNLTISNSKFFDDESDPLKQQVLASNKSVRGAFISANLNSNLTIDNCKFQYGYGQYGGSIYLYGGSKTSPNKIDKGGSIYAIDCLNFKVDNLRVKESYASQGGAIYLNQQQEAVQRYLKNDRQYYYKQEGGAIYLKNIFRSLLESNKFVSNQAETGGALYFECPDPYNCEYAFSVNNTFQNNFATISGGAFYWNDVEPIQINKYQASFQNNSAFMYANNIGSYPQKLIYITSQQFNAQLVRANQISLDYGQRRQLQDQALNLQQTSIEKDSVASGSELPEMYLALVDGLGQIVGTEDNQKLEVVFKGILSNQNKSQIYKPTLAGDMKFYSLAGVYVISKLNFTASPGYKYQLSFQSDGIDQKKPANSQNLEKSNQASQNNAQEQFEFALQIQLRECLVGERFTETGAQYINSNNFIRCEKCPQGKSFSLVQMNEPGNCKTCPASLAICNGGAELGPQPGFWRNSNVSYSFIKCLNPDACLGMIPPENNPQGSCLEGYKGILCADCQVGYSYTDSRFKCAKCPDFTYNLLRLIAILIVAVFIAVFLIRSTLHGAANLKNKTSVFQKILLNHIQLIVLTSSFDFDWPQLVLSYFQANKVVGDAAYQVFSIDCLLSSYDYYNSREKQNLEVSWNTFMNIKIFYFKLSMLSLLPLLIVIICSLVWRLIYLNEKRSEIVFSKIVSSIVILLFLVHPNIVKYVFDVFNCVDIDGESRLKNDLALICYSNKHQFWAFGLGLPVLIVWGLGIPLFAFILIETEKKSLESVATREKYGFLYRGYKSRFYYWEIFITYRKMFLIFIQVFLIYYGVLTQALNELETLSLITSLITVFCGIFFIINGSQYNLESENDVAMKSQMTKFSKIYTIVCLCGNQSKYEIISQKQQDDKENEVLKEKYQELLRNLSRLCQDGNLLLDQKNIEKIQIYLSKEQFMINTGLQDRMEIHQAENLAIKRKVRVKKSSNLRNQIFGEDDKKDLNIRKDTQQSNDKEIDLNFYQSQSEDNKNEVSDIDSVSEIQENELISMSNFSRVQLKREFLSSNQVTSNIYENTLNRGGSKNSIGNNSIDSYNKNALKNSKKQKSIKSKFIKFKENDKFTPQVPQKEDQFQVMNNRWIDDFQTQEFELDDYQFTNEDEKTKIEDKSSGQKNLSKTNSKEKYQDQFEQSSQNERKNQDQVIQIIQRQNKTNKFKNNHIHRNLNDKVEPNLHKDTVDIDLDFQDSFDQENSVKANENSVKANENSKNIFETVQKDSSNGKSSSEYIELPQPFETVQDQKEDLDNTKRILLDESNSNLNVSRESFGSFQDFQNVDFKSTNYKDFIQRFRN